jgi:hypothetical protein
MVYSVYHFIEEIFWVAKSSVIVRAEDHASWHYTYRDNTIGPDRVNQQSAMGTPWGMDDKWKENTFSLGSSSLANQGGLRWLLFFLPTPIPNNSILALT